MGQQAAICAKEYKELLSSCPYVVGSFVVVTDEKSPLFGKKGEIIRIFNSTIDPQKLLLSVKFNNITDIFYLDQIAN